MPKPDLALLKEILNVWPFGVEHGRKEKKYGIVTDNLNEYLESSLSSCTVKDIFVLLVDEFEKMDASGRRKSGVAADFDVYQQLLTDITGQMRGAKAAKVAKKSDKKAKCDRLETFSENLREVACNRPSKRFKVTNDSETSSDPRS
ncbi:hypothetical protein LEN26_007954 [Aphanomyces euteiches]|nr:hypothetical protein AeMF1_007842 [Aphanomyces euteiches]KAH9131048.1 hypothetical protein LEN26_007954 [Aphanomyces euteiches]KAH9186512.1 hypothetical protein AeNC1_011513 [Aphanomyces euteiches]